MLVAWYGRTVDLICNRAIGASPTVRDGGFPGDLALHACPLLTTRPSPVVPTPLVSTADTTNSAFENVVSSEMPSQSTVTVEPSEFCQALGTSLLI
jgi:hypothetical protein